MRPGIGLNASMSLPWLWGPNRDRARQAVEEERAEIAARDNERIATQSDVSEAFSRVLALEAQLILIRQRSLPATQRSLDAITTTFSTGGSTVLEWLDVARSQLDLELESIVLTGDLKRAVAALERAVGTQLPRTALRLDATR
jgi:outer membrane protein TolC